MVESRWNPAVDDVASGDESVEQSGSRAVWVGKFLTRSLQKQGVCDGWTPGPAGLVGEVGSLRASDSTMSLTKGQGSIVLLS